MSAQTTPFNQGQEFRNEMIAKFMITLQFLAWRATNKQGMKNSEFVIFCIAYDTRWRYIVDKVAPQIPPKYWQDYRDDGLMPVATFTGTKDMLDNFRPAFPDTAEEMDCPISEGMAKCMVLDDEGYSLYEIVPAEFKQPALN